LAQLEAALQFPKMFCGFCKVFILVFLEEASPFLYEVGQVSSFVSFSFLPVIDLGSPDQGKG